jgi:hypothetical protein
VRLRMASPCLYEAEERGAFFRAPPLVPCQKNPNVPATLVMKILTGGLRGRLSREV